MTTSFRRFFLLCSFVPALAAGAQTPIAAVAAPASGPVAAIERRLAAGEANEKHALGLGRDYHEARIALHEAAADFAAAAKAVERLPAGDPTAQSLAPELARRAKEGRIKALLTVAGLEYARSNWFDALGDVDQVLALDEANGEALRLRREIEHAAARPLWPGAVVVVRQPPVVHAPARPHG